VRHDWLPLFVVPCIFCGSSEEQGNRKGGAHCLRGSQSAAMLLLLELLWSREIIGEVRRNRSKRPFTYHFSSVVLKELLKF
jgi:hypothetical protein